MRYTEQVTGPMVNMHMVAALIIILINCLNCHFFSSTQHFLVIFHGCLWGWMKW